MLVVRNDNHYDCVDDFMLDSLIKSKEIVKFKRNPGWPLENPPPVAGSKSPTPVVGRTGVI
ncbi:hypothetical protein DS62_01730 [Smithella sp. SC_K08D17]|jgi:hypothetical protein|nr:hypothetical protein KD27_03445 [Smithella sp. D17]KIE17634.1 hypothetical protein DS62_01730 [Smithella sp. SC_K08D17]